MADHTVGSDELGSDYARTIVETLREPLLVLDDDLTVRFANPAFYRAFQVTPDETQQRHVHDLGNGQWNIADLRVLLDKVIEDDRGIEDYRVEHDFEEIGPRTMMLNARRFRNPEGRSPGRILLAIEDVTEQERARRELEAYASELMRSNQSLEEFAYVASHDLQEPLRKINAFGERLESVAGESLDERGRDYLDRMLDAGRRMHRMINDLLAYSRVSRRQPEVEAVPLDEVVEASLADLEVALEKSDARVDVEGLPVVRGDRSLLRLLMQNLISNAVKYSHDDRAPEIRIDGDVTDGEARLRVHDRGIGFDKMYLDRIFDPFQRLHGRGTYEGSGIGLAICRKIVESHEGTITATSPSGEGTTFVVMLPSADGEGDP